MKLERLHPALLAVAQAGSVEEALRQIVQGGADGTNVALVRIWLVAPGDICGECRFRAECPDQERCLHLVASRGRSRHGEEFSRVDGAHHRIPLGVGNIGRVGKSGEPLLLRDVRGDGDCGADREWIRREGVQTFAAQPLILRSEVLGVLALYDRDAVDERQFESLRIFADHAAVAISNARAFEEIDSLRGRLEVENVQLHEEFRDLFDEAPIAYVHEGVDSRLIRANRAALKILGIKPEELAGTFGSSLVADTPDAKRRLREAFESVGRGTETSGVVLELRRRDNGKPIWIQWWSKPAPGGNYTRTMFVDITDRVLMEQEQARLQAQNEYLMEEIRGAQDYGDIIGESAGLRKVIQQIQLVARTDAAVLINGESGTGKELVARAIHENSPRKGRALIKVNCGAIPESLFESEFFGHMRGAFTGAVRDKPGRFELADGGTLFLDEIGEMPLGMQAKLLRVLQEQEIERVGDTRTRKINVRIVAATNRDLKREVEAGRFRQDLFYRLGVFPLEIPPLRERREDIAKLAAHFVRLTARKMNRTLPALTKAQADQLTAHDWPGNIRELQNVVERAVILAQKGPMYFELPPTAAPRSAPAAVPPGETTSILTREDWKRQERDSIAAALKQSGGKVFGPGGAAELLNMKPTTLASRIKSLGIR
jgi:PAS domain S-box-containing protein